MKVILRNMCPWLSKTSDAHDVYAKCGFSQLEDPERGMGRMKPRPERKVFEG